MRKVNLVAKEEGEGGEESRGGLQRGEEDGDGLRGKGKVVERRG